MADLVHAKGLGLVLTAFLGLSIVLEFGHPSDKPWRMCCAGEIGEEALGARGAVM